MNFKRRGNRISLYRSSWVPKGPEVSHGHTRQTFIGSIQADATEISPELAAALTLDECEALKRRVLVPAAVAREAAARLARQRDADPACRLDEALRLITEAAERSQALPVLTTRLQLLRAVVDKVKTLGVAASGSQSTPTPDPLRDALEAIAGASEAVRQGRYGRGPKNGFRNTAVFRHWTEILAAVDASEHSLLRALQDAGFASRRKK